MPEATLVENLKNGDKKAISRIVEQHTAVLLRGALGQGWSPNDAEDLVQETFVTLLKAVQRFEGRSTVRTFLFGILYRKAKERGRKKAREQATDPIDAVFERRFGFMGQWSAPPKGPDEETLGRETAVLIGDCMEALVPAQRAAFHLKEVDRQDNASICNILEVTATHLRVLLFRARNNLRECLERKWETRK